MAAQENTFGLGESGGAAFGVEDDELGNDEVV